jgi:Flp pilus assembly protein TadG
MRSRFFHRALRALAAFGRDERGASDAVEFALVGPLLIAFIFGVYEFGQAVWTQGILDYAVEQAARCASVNTTTCGSANAIATYAAGLTTPLNLPSNVFTATTPICGNQVAASYTFSFVKIGVLPIINARLFPTTVVLTSTACFPLS